MDGYLLVFFFKGLPDDELQTKISLVGMNFGKFSDPQLKLPQKHQFLIGWWMDRGSWFCYNYHLFAQNETNRTIMGIPHPKKTNSISWDEKRYEVSGEAATCCPSMASRSATCLSTGRGQIAMGQRMAPVGREVLAKTLINGRGFGDSNVSQPNE